MAEARRSIAAAIALVLWLSAPAARAQDPLGPPGGELGPPGGTLPGQGGPQPQEGPETHAASGGETPAALPTEAAQLPEKPNEVPEQLEEVLASDAQQDFGEVSKEDLDRQFYGLYYSESKEGYSFRSVFPPVWMERRQEEDRASLYGMLYYNRRSPDYDADVLFPLFWHLRDHDTYTTVVGPVMHRDKPSGHDNWLVPLYFEGTGEDDHHYLHIPPLLTFHSRTARDGFTLVGPVFCFWTGGPRCDNRTADEIDMGVAPLYFYGRDDRSEYEIIPPLLHYYGYTERGEEEIDVWGPLWMERSREGGVFNILPLFWYNWGDNEEHITALPFFHYGYKGTAHLLATPLFVDREDDEGAHTFATYLYARHRGRTELDMFTPLVWLYRDPDIQLHRTLVFPFFYHNTSNRSTDLAVFPLFAHFERHAISRDLWITPLFRHQTSLTGWETDLFPIFYMGRENNATHLVVAPLLWDFASPTSRATVIFPLYWRFSDRESVTQVIGNTFYSEEKVKGGTDWQFHLFPLFSYGESPTGHWWNILYGFAGYTREGTMAKMRIGYIPIQLSD